MAELVLGPLLRYVSETEATVWVQASEQCEVEVLGRREPTFRVEGHQYALVRLEGLEPATSYEYEVALDGRRVWPVSEELPPSAIRTLGGDGPLDVCFGSCRVALPQGPPFTESAGPRLPLAPARRPYFDNQVATLRLDGRAATLRLDKTVPGENDAEGLRESFERRLA